MIVSCFSLWSLLCLFATGLANPSRFPQAIANITSLCTEPTSLTECSAFAEQAKQVCPTADLPCHCTQYSAIIDFCSTKCNFDKASVLENSRFMNAHCNKIQYDAPNTLQAAGILDRIRAHRNKDGEEEDEEDEDEHSTCNNGDDSDPGTNWMNYRRSAPDMPDAMDELVTSEFEQRVPINDPHLVVKPDHFNQLSSRTDASENADAKAPATSECWDLETARKHVVQEAIHAADNAIARTPRKNIEKFVDNMLSSIPFRKNRPSKSGTAPIYNDETTEDLEESDSHMEHEKTHDNDSQTEDLINESAEDTTEEVQENEEDSHEDSHEDEEVHGNDHVDESNTEGTSDVETSSEYVTHVVTSAAKTTSPGHISLSEPEPTSSSILFSSEHKSADLSSESESFPVVPTLTSYTTSSAASHAPETTTSLSFASPVPILEPPSLTIARAFSLADEIAMEEEREQNARESAIAAAAMNDGNDGWHEVLNEEEDWSEMKLASAFGAQYLKSETDTTKKSSQIYSLTTSTVAPLSNSTAVVAAFGLEQSKHNRVTNGNDTGSVFNATGAGEHNKTKNATKPSSTHAETSKKTSGGVSHSVSFTALALCLGVALSF